MKILKSNPNLNSNRDIDIKRYALADIDMLKREYQTCDSGLTLIQWRKNYRHYGENKLSAKAEENTVIKFLKKFFTPLSLLLIVLSIISIWTGELHGAVMISVMVLLSGCLSFFQEYRSSNAAKKLIILVRAKILVIRNGLDIDEDITKIVPGDIIRLSVGDLVPADVRILSAKDLFINQSSLTGESLPIEKYQYPLYSEISSPFDWNNLAFMGSHVVSGMGTALVLKTGNSSFFGEMTNEISIDKKKTTFDEGVNQFTWLMIRLMFAMIPSVFLINGLIKGDWLEAALFAIAVGVGLAPEMLPMIVTVNLAKGAISLSKNKVIIKRLTAVQNLGAMNILCADKTGTLTQNEIILEKHIDINGNDSKGVLEYAYLNSHYQTGLKNAMDLAILKHIDVHEFLHDKNNYQKIDEIPFDFERRRLSIIIRKNNSQDILICKGAVEEVYSCCQFVQIGDERVALTNQHKINIKTVVDTLNSDGFRVLAIAIHEEASSERVYKISDESELTLIGYIAFLDPPKESAMAAIKALQDCGIKIKILTGDNELITRRICQQVGLTINSSIAGSRIDGLNDEQILEVSLRHTIFYKMTPHQKARVINALRIQNNVVGYLGDGINDGPALKAADVSISVDTAVDIAKESADIILLEKSLMVLYVGVLEGRAVFGNIMKYLKMSASSNFGNMFSMLGASALLPFLPMASTQILLNNLLYDFSQTSVPTDSVDADYLKSPREWNIQGLTRYIFYIGPISSIFDYLTFGFLWFILGLNTLEMSSIFQTGWFIESLLSQTLVVYVIRTGKIPFKDSVPSLPLVITTLSICLVAILLPYIPIGAYFKLKPLPEGYWMGMAFLIPTYLLLTQAIKMLFVKKWGYL